MHELPIDQIVHDGLAFNPRLPVLNDETRSSVRALFEQLASTQMDYLLVGGVALLSYVQGRNTQDVDLIVEPAEVGRMAWNARLRDRDFGEATWRGIQVDLLLSSNPLFAHVKERARTTVAFAGLDVPCATREGLLLLKLYALPSLYRQGKLDRAALYETDILMLHQGVSIDDGALLAVLEQHLPRHDLNELRSILDEQRGRSRFTT